MRSLTLDVLVDRYAAVSDANRRRLDALAGLLDRFASQGIEVMLLKGADLLLRCYGPKGTRPLADIDLLARERDLPTLDRCLRESSFRPLIDGNPAYACPSTGLILDITTTLWYLDEASLDTVWRRAMPQPVGSAQALVMSGEDLLIHLTAYSVLHRGHLSESFMQDLSQLTRTVSLDWDRILQDSASWDLQMPLRHAFTTALANRPEPLIPDWVLSRLTPASQRDRLWLALLSRLVTGPPIAEVGHLLLLLSQPSGRRWVWLRNTLFPTRTFLGYRYGESAAHQPWRTRLRRWRDLFRAAAVLGCRVMARLAGGTEASLRRREPLESVPATAAISAADLSEQVPLSLIGNRVTFRVASDSMTPTLQAGDELTIGPATGLRIGDLVLYESEEGLVCHRLRATNEAGELVMSGDAAPSATEAVDGARVKGLVSAVIPRRASQQYLRHLVRQAGRRLLLGPLGRIGVALLMPWLTVTICARTSIRSMALWHPIDRARGLSRRTLETRLAKTAADQRPLSLRVSFGSTMLGSLECASGRIEVGAVGRRFGLDRLFHEIADRPS